MITLENVFDLIIGADGEYNFGDEDEKLISKYKLDKRGDKDFISAWEQYKVLQNFGFNLENRKVFISQELANFLTDRYSDLMIEVEEEVEIDLSGDYIMDFNRWVKGIESPIYW